MRRRNAAKDALLEYAARNCRFAALACLFAKCSRDHFASWARWRNHETHISRRKDRDDPRSGQSGVGGQTDTADLDIKKRILKTNTVKQKNSAQQFWFQIYYNGSLRAKKAQPCHKVGLCFRCLWKELFDIRNQPVPKGRFGLRWFWVIGDGCLSCLCLLLCSKCFFRLCFSYYGERIATI